MSWSGRESSRRISRNCRGRPVAISAQSLIRGPLDPVPHERRSNTASAAAWSARVTAPAAVMTWWSQGMMSTYASPACSQARRSPPLRPQTSPAATHLAGSPAAYANATPTLRRCAITPPRTALTWASTRTAHAATSPMLACAAVASSCFVTNSRTSHGRP